MEARPLGPRRRWETLNSLRGEAAELSGKTNVLNGLSSSAPNARWTAEPISAGLLTTCTPALASASIFSAAVPLPPAMIAPAWPMRRPGGAVCPAMNPTTGFRKLLAMNAAASSSAEAANLANHHDRLSSRIVSEQAKRIDEARPNQRVTADADAGRLAAGRAWSADVWLRMSVCRSSRQSRRGPSLQMWPGMIPAFACPGRNQTGAIRTDEAHLRPSNNRSAPASCRASECPR